MRDYKIVSYRPRMSCYFYRAQCPAANFVPSCGEFCDAPTNHYPKPTVGENCLENFYGKGGFSYRLPIAQKCLLHRQAILFSEHAPR